MPWDVWLGNLDLSGRAMVGHDLDCSIAKKKAPVYRVNLVTEDSWKYMEPDQTKNWTPQTKMMELSKFIPSPFTAQNTQLGS